jgi:hypothetical protein
MRARQHTRQHTCVGKHRRAGGVGARLAVLVRLLHHEHAVLQPQQRAHRVLRGVHIRLRRSSRERERREETTRRADAGARRHVPRQQRRAGEGRGPAAHAARKRLRTSSWLAARKGLSASA